MDAPRLLMAKAATNMKFNTFFHNTFFLLIKMSKIDQNLFSETDFRAFDPIFSVLRCQKSTFAIIMEDGL